jgi:glycosyltransferase involved in cell wall biosynthesis
MDISFILPTNRSHEYAKKVVDTINSIPTSYKYEILLYSPEEMKGDNIRWIEEHECKGPIAAFNDAIQYSKGQYLVCMIDDHVPDEPNNFFSFIDFLNSDKFVDRKYKITSFNTNIHHPNSSARVPVLGDTWCGYVLEEHNNETYTTMRFPIVDIETIKNHLDGHIFHPGFIYHAADLWLGYYLGVNGETGIECDASIGQYIHLRNSLYEMRDCRYYHKLKLNYIEGNKDYICQI